MNIYIRKIAVTQPNNELPLCLSSLCEYMALLLYEYISDIRVC